MACKIFVISHSHIHSYRANEKKGSFRRNASIPPLSVHFYGQNVCAGQINNNLIISFSKGSNHNRYKANMRFHKVFIKHHL